ncbi:MAG: fluoride efflux transporter CrcB [Steroidobacteraceae bacterium]
MRMILAICVGASAGAILRWWLSLALNHLYPSIPPGTLVANLVGAYIVGIAVVMFAGTASLTPEWRVLVITGFCGGLTTFSTFSAEIVALLQQGRFAASVLAIGVHVAGSVLMTFAGIGTVLLLRR